MSEQPDEHDEHDATEGGAEPHSDARTTQSLTAGPESRDPVHRLQPEGSDDEDIGEDPDEDSDEDDGDRAGE